MEMGNAFYTIRQILRILLNETEDIIDKDE